jgi:hypothetical protein
MIKQCIQVSIKFDALQKNPNHSSVFKLSALETIIVLHSS